MKFQYSELYPDYKALVDIVRAMKVRTVTVNPDGTINIFHENSNIELFEVVPDEEDTVSGED